MPKYRSRRHIADASILEKHGASPIVHAGSKDPTGIKISGWSITTSSSSIGNEGEMDAMTSSLQELIKNSRRIALPEIVFSKAYVALTLTKEGNCKQDIEETDSSKDLADLIFTAQHALEEWAECHSHLSLEKSGVASYKGVSVIKSVDAKLWEERQSRERQWAPSSGSLASSSAFVGTAVATAMEPCCTEFNYDWTYSTPYSGSSKNSGWKSIETSGIDLSLLTDQTQPIIFFDDVHLYEDDMHDNGITRMSCKIRVMPTCYFILLSLFVRVDHVLIRVKESRFFCKFNRCNASEGVQVFRDTTWRECSWEKLGSMGLPADVGSWRIEDELSGGQSVQNRIQGMLRILPQIPLPEGMPAYSCLDIN